MPLSTRGLDALREKLATNKTWFDGYFRANSVNLHGAENCDKRCRQVSNGFYSQLSKSSINPKCYTLQVHTCAISNVGYNDYRMCVTQAKALSASNAASGAAGTVAVEAAILFSAAVALLAAACH